jgi:hypothetical protein
MRWPRRSADFWSIRHGHRLSGDASRCGRPSRSTKVPVSRRAKQLADRYRAYLAAGWPREQALETLPVADEIATLTYVGEANAGRERWAFAFSAKEKWIEKIRSDVAGIVETDRGYQRIICVTARFARAKARAALEDELTAKYGIPVTIHDRSWIVKEVIDGDRKDLAYNYLGAGQLVEDGRRLSLGIGIEHARRLLSDARAVLAYSRELANAVRDDVRLRPALVYFTELSRFGFGRIRP